MKSYLSVPIAVVLACTILVAGSTKYVSSYHNPKASLKSLSGKKVACFVVIPSEELRGAREETVAAEMRERGIDAIAGYTILPGELVKDREKAKAFIKKAGIAGAIMLRLVNDQEAQKFSTTTVGGWYTQPYYGSFYGYWNYGWSSVYVYETTWTERVVTIETLIYSVENDELIWAGRSDTSSPKDIKKFVKELAEATGKELRKAGLVAK
jgi:hypothetical protein